MRFLKENVGETFMKLDLAMISWIWHQKHRQSKQKQTNGTVSNFKNFHASKNTISRMKRQPTEWEITVNYISDNRLILRIYKALQLNNKIKLISLKTGERTWINFSKEDTQMSKKHMKRLSTLLVIREIKIKAQWILPHTLQDSYYLKDQKKTKQNWKIRSENKKGVEKLELCTLLVGLQDGAAAMESR